MGDEAAAGYRLHLDLSSECPESSHHIRSLGGNAAHYLYIFQERLADIRISPSKYPVDVDQ